MKIYRIWLIIFLFAFAIEAQVEKVRVRVEKVHDGDTITVSDASDRLFKVRLIGIDAPELKQKFGEKSRDALNKILKRDKKNVIVQPFGMDRDKRILGLVFVGETDVNLELLRGGFAWVYESRELGKEKISLYREAMTEARANKFGLWKEENPVDPKEFRRRKREKN
jgi:endonuclease YncB( thermonuclease family)